MTDATSGPTLGELSEALGLELRGDPNHRISSVGTLAGATSSQLAFLANPGYRPQLSTTQAGAVIVSAADAERCPTNALLSDNPYRAYALAASRFARSRPALTGVHESAVVSPSAAVDSTAYIGPQCVVEADAVVDSGVQIGPGTVIGAGRANRQGLVDQGAGGDL